VTGGGRLWGLWCLWVYIRGSGHRQRRVCRCSGAVDFNSAECSVCYRCGCAEVKLLSHAAVSADPPSSQQKYMVDWKMLCWRCSAAGIPIVFDFHHWKFCTGKLSATLPDGVVCCTYFAGRVFLLGACRAAVHCLCLQSCIAWAPCTCAWPLHAADISTTVRTVPYSTSFALCLAVLWLSPGDQTQEEAFRIALTTWPAGVRPVVHWSESPEDPKKMLKAHSGGCTHVQILICSRWPNLTASACGTESWLPAEAPGGLFKCLGYAGYQGGACVHVELLWLHHPGPVICACRCG
jgi:hypothetical protein